MTLVLHAAAGQQHGEVAIAVNRTIAHTAAAENDERVVKNLGLQAIDEAAEFGGQKGFNDLQLSDPFLCLAVVRNCG